MIAPEHDHGVVGDGGLLQRVQHLAQHGIGIADRGEVALDEGSPFSGRDRLVEGHRGGELQRHVGQVGQVARRGLRQLDLVQRVEVEILLRHVPRPVRPIEPDRKEQVLALRREAPEEIHRVLRDLRVAGNIGIADVVVDRLRLGELLKVKRVALRRRPAEPHVEVVERRGFFAEHLAGRRREVACLTEHDGHRLGGIDRRELRLAVHVHTGRQRALPGHDGGAGRVAQRHRGEGAGEGDAHVGKALQVRRVHRPRVAIQHRRPIVKVVDDQHQDIHVHTQILSSFYDLLCNLCAS